MNTAAKSPTNLDVVVLALAQLGGTTEKLHSEEIAAKAFELAPEKFGWRLPQYRHRGWPDKELVRAALMNARTKANGRLVRGSYNTDLSKDGWQLTASGSEWVVEHQQRILQGLSRGHVDIPSRDALRFCRRMKREPLFKHFTDHRDLQSASQYDLTDLLECSPDARREIIHMKFDRLMAAARLVKDEQILEFLQACTSRFAEVLSEGAVVALDPRSP